MQNHNIYWWNLENLFDIENSPRRSQFLNNKLDSELIGWTQAVLDQKIDNLSSVIAKFNNNTGPDILGVCEVENAHVLHLLSNKLSTLLGRNYTFSIIVEKIKEVLIRHLYTIVISTTKILKHLHYA